MNRGSEATAAGDSGAHCCFNEAPIHESGKSLARLEHAFRRVALQ